MSDHKRSLPRSLWWSAGSVVLMVVGAFGPWASVADLVTVHGTDGASDGWIVVGAAAVAVIAMLFYRRQRRWLLVLPLLAGIAGAATTAYDISNANELASSELFGSIVSVEWGIYVALAGSISLALSSLGLMFERRGRAGAPSELPSGA